MGHSGNGRKFSARRFELNRHDNDNKQGHRLEGHTVNLLVCCLTIAYSQDDRKRNLEATVDCFCLLFEQLLNHQILMIGIF